MPLVPLLDRTGELRAWADRKSGWVFNPIGNAFALVEFDGFFRFYGTQLGWFYGDHVRDRQGKVFLARPSSLLKNLARPKGW